MDDTWPALLSLYAYVRDLFQDPIFLALLGCALVAWLVTRDGPTLKSGPT